MQLEVLGDGYDIVGCRFHEAEGIMDSRPVKLVPFSDEPEETWMRPCYMTTTLVDARHSGRVVIVITCPAVIFEDGDDGQTIEGYLSTTLEDDDWDEDGMVSRSAGLGFEFVGGSLSKSLSVYCVRHDIVPPLRDWRVDVQFDRRGYEDGVDPDGWS